VACAECERLNKAEIECGRLLEAAQTRLAAFFPEPPFGEAASNQLRSFERAAETSRASLESAKRQRTAHRETHAMTLSR
jgi:hypothetical protein